MTEPTPTTPDSGGAQELTSEQADATIRSRQYIALLVVVAVIGVVVSTIHVAPSPASCEA